MAFDTRLLRADLTGKIQALDISIAEEKAEAMPLTRLIAKWAVRRDTLAEILDTLDQLEAVSA